MITFLVAIPRPSLALIASDLQHSALRASLYLDALSADEGVVGNANTDLATLLQITAGLAETIGTLGLGHCVLSTGHDQFAFATDRCVSFLADAHLLADSSSTLLLHNLVIRTNLNGYADSIHSCESSWADTHLRATN